MFELTKTQRLILIGSCFLVDAIVYALYPLSAHRNGTGEALLLFLAGFCIASFISVLNEKNN